MSRKKTFTDIELADLSAEEIINKIKYENYSLLTTLGSENLRKEMVPVGRACNAAIDYFFGSTGPKYDIEKHNRSARRKLVKTLSRLTPGSYDGIPKDSNRGLVVGFNHPSLGEIARILTMKIDLMGDKPMYFPVNLPWYESLAPNSDRIERLGIVLTPTITPSTWRKMDLVEGTIRYDAGQRLKKSFRDIYTDLSDAAVKKGGVIFVAPSATRQATVFKNEAEYKKTEPIIPTMSVLALRLLSDPEINCDFLPLAVLPPNNYKRGLNFHKNYTLIPGKVMTASYIRKKYFTTPHPDKLDGFDWDFHKRLADELPRKFWY